jgi:deferrochelatase/peroxidase EfeB
MTNDIGNVQAGIVTPLPDGWQHRLDVVISLTPPVERDGSLPSDWSVPATTGFAMLLDAVDWEDEERPTPAETATITFGLTARGHRHLRQLIPDAPALSMLDATEARWTTLGDTPRTYESPLTPGTADLVLLLAGPDAAALVGLADGIASAFGSIATQERIASIAANADAFGFAEGAGNPRSVGANPPDARAEPRPPFNAAWFVCASLPGVVAASATGGPRLTTPAETPSKRWQRGGKKPSATRDPVQPNSYTDPVRSTNFAVACRAGDTLLVWRKLEQHRTNFAAVGNDADRDRIVGRHRDGSAFAAPGPPPTSHVARSKPDGARGLILRRSSRFAVQDGSVERTGLFFRCFQRDISVGYEWVQRRLAVPDVIQGVADDDPLTGTERGFVTARGGDYYLVPGRSRVELWKRLFGERVGDV